MGEKAAAKPKSSFKLNPNAKPFTFNPSAKEFVPSFGDGGATKTPAAVTGSSPPPTMHLHHLNHLQQPFAGMQMVADPSGMGMMMAPPGRSQPQAGMMLQRQMVPMVQMPAMSMPGPGLPPRAELQGSPLMQPRVGMGQAVLVPGQMAMGGRGAHPPMGPAGPPSMAAMPMHPNPQQHQQQPLASPHSPLAQQQARSRPGFGGGGAGGRGGGAAGGAVGGYQSNMMYAAPSGPEFAGMGSPPSPVTQQGYLHTQQSQSPQQQQFRR